MQLQSKKLLCLIVNLSQCAANMMASILSSSSPPQPKHMLREDDEEPEEELEEIEQRIFPVNAESSSICASLETKTLWKRFDELGTEMIVTRRGR